MLSSTMSRPASHNAFGDIMGSTGIVDRESFEGLRSSASTPGLVGLQNHGVNLSHSFAPAVYFNYRFYFWLCFYFCSLLS